MDKVHPSHAGAAPVAGAAKPVQLKMVNELNPSYQHQFKHSMQEFTTCCVYVKAWG